MVKGVTWVGKEPPTAAQKRLIEELKARVKPPHPTTPKKKKTLKKKTPGAPKKQKKVSKDADAAGDLVFDAGEHEVDFGAISGASTKLGAIRVEKGASVTLRF